MKMTMVLMMLMVGCGNPYRHTLTVDPAIVAWNNGQGGQLLNTAIRWWADAGQTFVLGDGGIPVIAQYWGRWHTNGVPAAAGDADGVEYDLTYFDYVRDSGEPLSYVTQTLAHEFGHVLGLQHVPDSSAVMYYKSHPNDRGLNDSDFAELSRVGL
jgi:hypothetical protein